MPNRSFSELIASRRSWIDGVLVPWCREAGYKDLRLAGETWGDIAGKVDPEKTLWFWAWSRFPQLVQPELLGIDETAPVRVALHDGRTSVGYPDARQSRQGTLTLVRREAQQPRRFTTEGPFTIDEIATIEKA